MNKNTKILVGCGLVIGGIVAYNNTDNKINIKGDLGGRFLSVAVIALGGYVLYKSIK